MEIKDFYVIIVKEGEQVLCLFLSKDVAEIKLILVTWYVICLYENTFYVSCL